MMVHVTHHCDDGRAPLGGSAGIGRVGWHWEGLMALGGSAGIGRVRCHGTPVSIRSDATDAYWVPCPARAPRTQTLSCAQRVWLATNPGPGTPTQGSRPVVLHIGRPLARLPHSAAAGDNTLRVRLVDQARDVERVLVQ
eukprot:gene7676-biopygen5868